MVRLNWMVLFGLLTLSGMPALLTADDAVMASEADASVQATRAPVIVDGHVLFSVRGASVYPAEQRAAAISQRVRDVAADPAVTPEALRLNDAPNATSIFAGDTLIMRVFDADAMLEKVGRPTLAELYSHRISSAIKTYRMDRKPFRLLRNLAQTGFATLLLAVILWSVWKGFQLLIALAQRHIKSAIEQIQSKVSHVIQTGSLWSILIGLCRLLRSVLLFSAIYAYLAFVLELFPWTRAFGTALLSVLLNPLQRIGRGFIEAFPGLVFVTIVVFITRYALKVLRIFFRSIELGQFELSNFDRDWAWPTYKIVRIFVVAFAVVIAYPYIPGSNSDAFKGVSLLLGLVFSLGSSSVISNLVAGYSMTYRRTFKLGDIIRVGDVSGAVSDIGLVVTRIRTPKNEDVVVPNSQILNNHVVNYSTLSKKEGLILHTTACVGYDKSWRQVEAMFLIAAERTPGLLKYPKPFVLLKELGDFAVTYELNVYCDVPQKMFRLYTELHKNILDLFNEHSIQIMTPAYEGDPEKPKVVPQEKWYAAPATRDAKPIVSES